MVSSFLSSSALNIGIMRGKAELQTPRGPPASVKKNQSGYGKFWVRLCGMGGAFDFVEE
jgi:hypothetical protein